MKKYIKEHMNAMIKDLMEFVSIPSIFCEEETGHGQPFGTDVRRGLEWILSRAEAMGMKVRNFDGYAGDITAGNGDYMIGVLVHEDVVPAGEGWTREPFHPQVEEGRIYGRGTSDDKGPAISCLYAMKYLMDEGKIPEDTCLRMIVGTNEEEAWEGITYYTEHVDRLPDYSIVPDGYFPLIFCEKGLLDLNFSVKCTENQGGLRVKELSGGTGRNVVPGKARCVLDCSSLNEEEQKALKNSIEGTGAENMDVCLKEGILTITAEGKSTHAMSPEKGINAISCLVNVLGSLPYTTNVDVFLKSYQNCIGMEYNGVSFGCGFEDTLSGKLTFNVGTICLKEGVIEMEVNLRYPASMEMQQVMDAVRTGCEKAGWNLFEKDALEPVCIEPDSPFVQRLMDVYREVTGDCESEAFAIGGATYARAIPNAAAYGPLFPYEEELAHEANEFLAVDSLEKMTLIYTKALETLLQMNDLP
ncbi:MAG: Sapep family Mn(2+)-dependent dipeptidase [Firmicutes bacterium]|nr:Sapep family Mn(2+)-dependent dipeptidase [Bacillota bacterium]